MSDMMSYYKDSVVEVIKDKFVDKKYIIKIGGGCGGGSGGGSGSGSGGGYGDGDGTYKRKIFFTLLKQLSQLRAAGEIFNGLTTGKDFCGAFFYVNHNCCSLREFFKNNITVNGNGSGYSFDNEYISGNNNHCNISYDQAVFMADSLTQQICLLEKMGYGFYCFLLDNIYVIDNHIFVYLGIEHIIPISGGARGGSREKIIRFMVPYPEKTFITNHHELYDYNTNLFICPEIKSIQNIPCSILYSSTYYHLASFIIYCMFNKNICFNDEELGGHVELLSSIKNTKLYWFLIRCIDNEPSKRILLWI